MQRLLRSTTSVILVGLLASITSADPPLLSSAQDAIDYDSGVFGAYPSIKTITTHDIAPKLLRRAWDEARCRDGGDYYFFAPHGFMVGHAGPTIFDMEGHQVWFTKGFPATYGLEVQTYRGEQYLCFWAGNNVWRDHGKGFYYMYDKHYQLYKKIEAVGEGKDGDLHDFIITADNTAIFTIYQTIPWNLRPFGVEPANPDSDGWINDSLFQEVDIETNELIFEWRASDFISLEDCYGGPEKGKGKSEGNAWDWFHINSVEKDRWGNYLISSRYTHALYSIERKTGKVIWELGGMHNNFTDLSGGLATNIARQHHARWHDDYNSITVFDNGNEGPWETWYSRALHIAVDRSDRNHMTAKLIAEAIHPHNYTTINQGSVQKLPGSDGNLLVGWGNTGAWTEFSADGSEVLCDWQYTALFAKNGGEWSAGTIESYRVFRGDWHGYPLEDPAVSLLKKDPANSALWVSWNGATELKHWALDGAYVVGRGQGFGDTWERVQLLQKQGFETNISVDMTRYEALRLTALDTQMEILGMWVVWPNGLVEKLPLPSPLIIHTSSTPWPLLVLSGLISATLAITIYTFWLFRLSRRRRRQIQLEDTSSSSITASAGYADSDTMIGLFSPLARLFGLDRKKSWYELNGTNGKGQHVNGNGHTHGNGNGTFKMWDASNEDDGDYEEGRGGDTVALMSAAEHLDRDRKMVESETVVPRVTSGVNVEADVGRRNSFASSVDR